MKGEKRPSIGYGTTSDHGLLHYLGARLGRQHRGIEKLRTPWPCHFEITAYDSTQPTRTTFPS
jgi:hypothetical protein